MHENDESNISRGEGWCVRIFGDQKLGHNDLPEMTKDVLPLKWEVD